MKQIAESRLEKLRAHYLDERDVFGKPVELTEQDRDAMHIMETAFTYMLDFKEFGTKDRVSKHLMKLFNIESRQAYYYIAGAERLFGDVRRSSKEALRYIITETAKDILKLAIETKDLKAATNAMREITKANNLDKEDMDIPDPKDIQPPIQLLQINLDFITSRYANVVDDTAKVKINQLIEEIQKLINGSKIDNYLDVTYEDIPKIEAHGADTEN